MDKESIIKILIIEDQPYIREGLKYFLEDYNYKVITAENGRKGLECFEKELPDVILCDLCMPELDGFDVLKTVVKLSPNTPIIIVSGAGDISQTVKSLKMGAWDYIVKPIQDMSVVLHSIAKSLERASFIKEKEFYKASLLNKAVDAGRSQLSAMILHNIGNAITPVSVYTEKLKNRNFVDIIFYLAKCYENILEHKDNLTEYITKDQRGIDIINYTGSLIETLKNEIKIQSDVIDKISIGVEYVAQILTLQRSYAPCRTEIREKININTLVNDAVKLQELSILKRSIKLEKNFLENIPYIIMEKNKLMQVVVNLIKNSCEAIDENKAQKEHKLEISTYFNNNTAGLKIKDSGIGVEKERQKEIFDFGISSKGSSGFGLYYCKTFIESNNGILRLESEGKGFGSTFILELPSIHKL